MELDTIDKQILNILLQDANTSYVDIAKQIHVSPGTVHVRMKNLKGLGLVQGANLVVDNTLLGLNMVAFVGIFLERSSYYMEVLLRLNEIPEVVSAHYVTGPYNLFAKIICRDSQHLHEILHDQIQPTKGVQRTESIISLNESIQRSIVIK